MKRRTFIRKCSALPLIFAGCQQDEPAPTLAEVNLHNPLSQGETNMYGLIAKLSANAGNRDALIEILLAGTKDMPGCKLYAISADVADENGIWVTEIWDSEESHQASLQLPNVQKALAEGKPMIAGFSEHHVVTPAGGFGVQ